MSPVCGATRVEPSAAATCGEEWVADFGTDCPTASSAASCAAETEAPASTASTGPAALAAPAAVRSSAPAEDAVTAAPSRVRGRTERTGVRRRACAAMGSAFGNRRWYFLAFRSVTAR